ncbi:MAG: ribosome maturation factor RimP [Bacilli bacterium]|jgi:ribosome maturation factor RimP|nr:ribosome maturation factor RimP [Bacilli bacterium]
MFEKIKESILPIINEYNLELYDVEYVKEHNENILRIFIDKKGGISLDDIVEVTPLISDLMDEIDIIKNEYLLEISSPGAEKVFKNRTHFEDNINEFVYVKFINPLKGMNDVEGYLLDVNDEGITIQYLVKAVKKQISINWDNIKLARQAIKF